MPAAQLGEAFEKVVRALMTPGSKMKNAYQQFSAKSLGIVLRDSVGTLVQTMAEPQRLVEKILEGRLTTAELGDTWILAEEDWESYGPEQALKTLHRELLKLGHAFHLGSGKHVADDIAGAKQAYDLIKGALEQTTMTLQPDTKLYRARLDLDKKLRATAEEFRSPPVKFAKAARANIQGERVCYLAADSDTARAEMRPGRASKVTVVEFVLKKKLRLCGLAQQRPRTSPFDDLDKYQKEKAAADFANALGAKFAKPVRPSDTDTEYVITQFLARMVREDGFDGIAYPSSQNNQGLNYVLFDPTLDLASEGAVKTFRCENVSYQWSKAVQSRPVGSPEEDDLYYEVHFADEVEERLPPHPIDDP